MTTEPRYRLGKKPARPGAVKFALRDYLSPSPFLPAPPIEFGYDDRVAAWAMLGNDQYGDCVLAGGAHETMLWDAIGCHSVSMTDTAVLSDYSAITGFNPADPNSDQGTDMQAAASYRLKTGLIDAAGTRHKIGAYVAITPGDLDEHKFAAWTFAAVGIGLTVSDAQLDQFDAGEPWDGPLGSNPGGHYVTLIGFRAGYLLVVTWGKVQRVSQAFFQANNDESLAYFSEEMVNRGTGPTGLYVWRLRHDLAALAGPSNHSASSSSTGESAMTSKTLTAAETAVGNTAANAYLKANMPGWELAMVPQKNIDELVAAVVAAVDAVRDAQPQSA